jgi:hypothetical protein
LLLHSTHEPRASQYGWATGQAPPSRHEAMQMRVAGSHVAPGAQSADERHSTQRCTVVSQRRYGSTLQSEFPTHSTQTLLERSQCSLLTGQSMSLWQGGAKPLPRSVATSDATASGVASGDEASTAVASFVTSGRTSTLASWP